MRRLTFLALLLAVAFCSYNETLGYHLCKLTVASYCNPSHVKDWSCGPCLNAPIKLTNVKPFSNSTGDVLGYIGTSNSPKAIIVVFRGTEPWFLKNWIEDINFIAVKYPPCSNKCEVHRGFYHAYLEIQAQVEASIKQYKTKHSDISRIIVTGHSLGGALATHAVVDITKLGYTVDDFYNYGTPRVGYTDFSEWFDKYVKTSVKNRITHSHDPVPHLPFELWGFKHVPHEFYYKGKLADGYVQCDDSSSKEDKSCSDVNKDDVNAIDHLTYYDIDFSGIIVACQA